MAKKLTSNKAKEILHDKSVHGHPLTDKQRKFFGAIAGGAKPYQDGGWLDKYEDGGVLKQKTHDNYGKKPNANYPEVTLPPGYIGEAYNIQGRDYSPAWGGQFQDGGFLQPTSPKLPKGYVIPYRTPSTELAMSIGGEDGEPAYLIPSFKYGKPLADPIAEFRKTGEHLGGPFKTWQEAEKFGELRHKYVEKGENIPTPLRTWGDMQNGGNLMPPMAGADTSVPMYQMGGGIPGATGMMYARTVDPAPSNGPYAKKTKASAQNGKEMKYYQEGLDFKPKSIAQKGKKVDNIKIIPQSTGDTGSYYNIQTDPNLMTLSKPVERPTPAEIRLPEHQSKAARAWEIITNPMEAFGYAARNQAIPKNFSRARTNTSALNDLTNILNPFSRVDAAANLVGNVGDLGKHVFQGSLKDASYDAAQGAVNLLGTLDLLQSYSGVARRLRPAIDAAKQTYKLTPELPYLTRLRNSINSGTLQIKLPGDIGGHSYFNMTPEQVSQSMKDEIANLPQYGYTCDNCMSSNSAPLYWTNAARMSEKGWTPIRTGFTQPVNLYGTQGKRVAEAIPEEAKKMYPYIQQDFTRRVDHLRQIGRNDLADRALKEGNSPDILRKLTDDAKLAGVSSKAGQLYNQFLNNYRPNLDRGIQEVNRISGLNFPMTETVGTTNVMPSITMVKGNPLGRLKDLVKDIHSPLRFETDNFQTYIPITTATSRLAGAELNREKGKKIDAVNNAFKKVGQLINFKDGGRIAQGGTLIPPYGQQYLAGNTGDLRGPTIDPRFAENVSSANKRNKESTYEELRSVPGLKLYSDTELRRMSKEDPTKWSKHVQQEYNDRQVQKTLIKSHPDYDPETPLNDQQALANDQSLRTRILRGKNLVTDTEFGGGAAAVANDILLSPLSLPLNLGLDPYNKYVKPGFAEGASNVIGDIMNSMDPSHLALLATGAKTLVTTGAKAALPKLAAAAKLSTALPFYKIVRTAEEASPLARREFQESIDNLKNLVEKPQVKQAFKDLGEKLAIPRVVSTDPMYAQAITDPNLPLESIDELAKSLTASNPADVALTKPQVKYIKELGNISTDFRSINLQGTNVNDIADYISERSANLSPRDVVPFIHQLPVSNDKKLQLIKRLYDSRQGVASDNSIARYTAAQDLFGLAENFKDLRNILSQSRSSNITYTGNQIKEGIENLILKGKIVQPVVGINDPYFLSQINSVNNNSNVRDIFFSLFRENPTFGGIPTAAEREASVKNIAKKVSQKTKQIFTPPVRSNFPEGSMGDMMYRMELADFNQRANDITYIGSKSMSSDSYEMSQRAALMKDRLNFNIIPMHGGSQFETRPSVGNMYGGITGVGSIKRNYLGNLESNLAASVGKLSPSQLTDFLVTHRSVDPKVIQNMMIESRYANAINADINRQLGTNLPASVVDVSGTKIERPLLGFTIKQQKDGGVVKDNMGYWNPENWGKVVEIDSNDITMKGVNQPLLGISDEGDVQYMEPGKDYKFKGKKVKEYPVGKKGVSVNKADENPNQKLDQLLNFTNYNKPTNGGWLDKYQ